jgi:hypothetical protein
MKSARAPLSLRSLGPAPRAIAIAVGVALATPAVPARAQEAPDPSATTLEARDHFDRGVKFYDEADYAAARVEFERAYALAPAWQVLFNVGQSQFQLRRYAQALVTLRRFLAEGGARVPAERRTIVESELADLANRIGHLAVVSNVAGATVSIDGEPAGTTPLAEPALVSVGIRHLRAVYTGPGPARAPVETDAAVAVGETVTVHLDFAELPEPAPAPPRSAATAVAPPPRGANHTPSIVAFGVAVAGAVAGGVFGGLTLGDKSRLTDECAGKACAPKDQPDIDAASRDGAISTVAFSVAGAALAAGVVLWLAAGPGHTENAGTTHAPLAPRVTLAGPGFVAGTF